MHDAPTPAADALFDHVVVAIDETPESLVAAAQARVLRAPAGQLVLVGVAERYLAAHAGMAARHAEDALVAETEADLARASEIVDADASVLASGRFAAVLCAECERRDANLVAVGVRPHRRLGALAFGGHDVDALHDVPSSVLIARPGWGPSKPERILVAVDGSPEARVAEWTARALAARLEVPVLPVVGLTDGVALEVLRAEREDALFDPRPVAAAVVDASTKGSLVVVGRGEHRSRRWGGDLAERVVYSARCSVLVVHPDAASDA